MIIKGTEVKERLLQGINLVADTVKPTLGPQARTVILQGNPPVIINDGVTITKYISHADPYVQMGIQLVQNLASKAQDNTGDGTTTACILAQALCQGLADSNVIDVHSMKKELESGRNAVLNYIGEMTQEVNDNDILDIATIAANNDKELGELITEVLDIVGRDGVITVEEGNALETTFEVKEGLEIDEGYFSHLMAGDTGIAELKNPLVLATNHTLTNFHDMMPVLEMASAKGRPLLILCKNIQGTALSNTLMNIIQGRISCCIVKSPNFGDAQLDELDDITSLLGGRTITDENEDEINMVKFDELGQCEKVIITKNTTTFIGGKGNVKDKVSKLKKMFEETDTNFDKARLKKRISRLSGGVAAIRVGAGSSIEMRETKERLDDALNATKAALQEGIVLGGGKTLYEARNVLHEEVLGENIIKDALLAPLTALLANNNHTLTFELSNSIKAENIGYNALTGEVCNLKVAGIIDPSKVTRSSFSVAMSIAMLFLTTDVAVMLPEV